MAITHSPTLAGSSRSSMGRSAATGSATLSSARSSVESVATTVAGTLRLRCSSTLTSTAPRTTCSLVRISPSDERMMPEPIPRIRPLRPACRVLASAPGSSIGTVEMMETMESSTSSATATKFGKFCLRVLPTSAGSLRMSAESVLRSSESIGRQAQNKKPAQSQLVVVGRKRIGSSLHLAIASRANPPWAE